MLTKNQKQSYTLEEYRQLEEVAQFRSEYRNGEIVNMAGGTVNHNRIAVNICTFLKFELRGKNIVPFMSDLRLWIPQYRRGTYPDIMAIEGTPIFSEGRKDEVLNPVLIVEVLSHSTEDFDRENKFRFYRSIPELHEYVLVDQYEFLVEHYLKNATGQWLFQEERGEAATVSFTSVGVQMSMGEIYEGVVFEPEQQAP